MADGGAKHDYLGPMLIAIAVLGLALWTLGGDALRKTSWSYFRAQTAVVERVIVVYPPSYKRDHERFKRILARDVPDDLPAGTLWEAWGLAGKFLAPPIALVLVVLGIWMYRRSPAVRYSRTLDFEGLLKTQAKTYPRMRPVQWLKGRVSQAERGNFWWPLTPFEWAARVKAVSPTRNAARNEASWSPAAAKRAFAAQLGRLTSGDLHIHEEILLAAFALKIAGQVKPHAELLDDAAAGFGPDWSATKTLWMQLRGRSLDWPANGPWRLDLSPRAHGHIKAGLALLQKGRKELAAREDPDEPLTKAGTVAEAWEKSAHIRCALARLLEIAKTTGLITSSDFIWVKAVDRTLHYALNDVGRRVSTSEAAGIRSHMQAEDRAGRPLVEPQVDEAVRVLRIALAESAWLPPPAMAQDVFTGWQAAAQSAASSLEGATVALGAIAAAGQAAMGSVTAGAGAPSTAHAGNDADERAE